MFSRLLALICISCLLATGGIGTEEKTIRDIAKGFEAFSRALRERDQQALLLTIAVVEDTADKHQRFIENMLKKLPPDEKQSDGVYLLLANGQIVRIQMIDSVTRNEKEYPRCQVWLLDRKNELYGYVMFIRENGNWKWTPHFMESPIVVAAYDFNLPQKALAAIKQAIEIKDHGGIFENIDPHLTRQMNLEEYLIALQDREGDDPDFAKFDKDHLEVEEIPVVKDAKDRRKNCKVWQLDGEEKRVAFEVFVQDGGSWKWIPKEDYRFFPKKEQDKSNAGKIEKTKTENRNRE